MTGGNGARRLITAGTMVLGLLAAPIAASAEPLPSDQVLQFPGHGWGHARGLGQWGARGMAEGGSSFTQILTRYYSSVTMGSRGGEDIRALVEESEDVVVTSTQSFGVS